MDFVSCSSKHTSKNCCGCNAETDSEQDSCDHIYASLVECKNKSVNNEDFFNIELGMITSTNKRNEDFRKKPTPWSTNSKILTYQTSPVLPRKTNGEIDGASSKQVTRSPHKLSYDANFLCPRCGQRMDEPRLLPCLHPMCLPCVYELMNRPLYVYSESEIQDNNRAYVTNDVRETCPLCDSHLPDINSVLPPPHYPLQHRLVMDTVRRKLVNRILCDTCTAEILAIVQCSTCLRNFCSGCSRQHELQNITEAKTIKHLMRPLWGATKVRRTILCKTHPTHTLRFYCIACQQITCKECMWSPQHRGHASEDAIGIGKRVNVYLTTMLQKARVVLNDLLIQYDYDIFSNNGYDESQNTAKSYR